MVRASRGRPAPAPEPVAPSTRSTAVSLHDVLAGSHARLEAAAYGLEMRHAVAAIRAAPFPTRPLFGPAPEGLCHEAPKPVRVTRVFVDETHGVPWLSSSDIIGIRPDPGVYISRRLLPKIKSLMVRQHDVLISRSGTIGNVALAGDRVAGMAASEDVTRLRAPDPATAGFVTAFLRSRFGRPQLIQSAYGSVIVHIEPDHLTRVLVPDVPAIRRVAIGEEMCAATTLRDDANRLLDEADAALHRHIGFPSVERLTRHVRTRPTTRASALDDRFEARYHDPAARSLTRRLWALAPAVAPLADPRVADVRAVTKFRKRVYVRAGGMPLLPSKPLFQVDPVEVKGLARGAHLKDLPEIGLAENMILVTCSGTIGRVHIVPKYMAAWAASQDTLRVVTHDSMNPGFVYAWLASEYGQLLIGREAYGSVIVHIDKEMLGSIPVPLLTPRVRIQIGDLVLRATSMRDEAWNRERAAISQIESLIEQT